MVLVEKEVQPNNGPTIFSTAMSKETFQLTRRPFQPPGPRLLDRLPLSFSASALLLVNLCGPVASVGD